MYIDKYLSWNFHIQHISRKLSRANGILSKLRHNAPINTCLQVYYAIFHSHLIYGCSLWGLTTEENLNKIEILQKTCLRIMTFSDFSSHTNPLFMDLKLKIEVLILGNIGSLIEISEISERVLRCKTPRKTF